MKCVKGCGRDAIGTLCRECHMEIVKQEQEKFCERCKKKIDSGIRCDDCKDEFD